MKAIVSNLLTDAIAKLQSADKVPAVSIEIQVENCRDKSHGDYASNIAMMLAKPARKNPRELAELIIEALPESEHIQTVEIAGPGFLNFTLSSGALNQIIPTVLQAKNAFGIHDTGKGKTVNVEFISANPTGPLHVGHGRGAAFGDAIADLLAVSGYAVEREYYVNDAGRQMNILAVSIWLRYLELFEVKLKFPKNGYKGGYVIEIAESLKTKYQDKFLRSEADVFQDVPADEVITDGDKNGDKEAHIDGIIQNAEYLLGKADYEIIFSQGLTTVLNDIKEDTKAFGIEFQNWFSEKSLKTSGAIKRAIKTLEQKDYLYEKDGATWFKSTDFGDTKDRVVIRENGQTTYFASDLAYLLNKIERGFDKIIYVFGADHHGYVPRLRAAAKAFGIDDTKLIIPLVQFAVLYRGTQKVQMSTRSGEFVTLRDLRQEVGKDACRYFYVMRKVEQHMDFDLELAKSNSKDNPVYYIQYAHARICRVLRRLEIEGYTWDESVGLEALSLLDNEYEKALITQLNHFTDIVAKAASQLEPHLLANYLRTLAQALHGYYDASNQKILVEDSKLRNARLCLVLAVKQVLQNGLKFLTIDAPEKM